MSETSPNTSPLSKSLNDTVEESDDYESDHSLKIVTESPIGKSKRNHLEISVADKNYIETIEQELDKFLDEKAAKSNLTVQNVKNLLRHIVSNEHLLALIKRVEDPEKYSDELSQFEPKLTRAKAKELFSTQPPVPLPSWISPPLPTSETQVLINEELPDDDSEEEYIPTATGEDESEDDRDTSIISESDPATPYNIDPSTQTITECYPPDKANDVDTANTCTVVEDGGGVFKVPSASQSSATSTHVKLDETNIALRTRSKLCLSDTPLEVIEEAFIPPDITMDMYDMECDDDDWTDFLRCFMRPLDEVAKPRDDEDHDPEYNILEDDSINKIDKEELRADRAVEVTKKELSDLIAELFDYTNNFDDRENVPPPAILPTLETVPNIQVLVPLDTRPEVLKAPEVVEIKEEENTCYYFQPCEIHLLQQQIRQHVQLLTQSFVMSYLHPEYGDLAGICKEYLYNIKLLPVDLQSSVYNVCNLNPAIEFLENWTKLLDNKYDITVLTHMDHVARVLNETRNYKSLGRDYIPKFSKLVLQHVSLSGAFLYPTLLPHIPSVPRAAIRKFPLYLRSEEELIAIGLEQFIPYLIQDKQNLTVKKDVKLMTVAHYLQCYMLPTRQAKRIYRFIMECRKYASDNSPITYYFKHKVAPATIHYFIPVEELKIVPPCKRPLEQLPELWKQYMAALRTANAAPVNSRFFTSASVPSLKRITKPPLFNTVLAKRQISPRRKRSTYQICSYNGFVDEARPTSTPHVQPRRLEDYFQSVNRLANFKFNSSLFKNLQPNSMPQVNKSQKPASMSQSSPVILENVSNAVSEIEDTAYRETVEAVQTTPGSKNNGKKSRVSVAEKRKQKFRKEFNANLNMLLPDDPHVSEEKTNMFVQAFYDKVRDQLDLPDYHKFMEILNDFDEDKNTAQELYKNVVAIVENKYPDIGDEFLTFLTTAQAKSLGKLVPHFMLGNMSFFLRRLEMYFKEQPSQVKKIYHALAELSENKAVTMELVKSTILPLLKGNALIIDWFLQFFPSEKPSQKLLNGPWETIELGKDSSVPNSGEDLFETITIPEVDDPYGGTSCICSCHDTDDNALKSRLKHCIPCGTKFLQGRVYIQTGKGLRIAKISFSDDDTIDNYARLACKTTTTKRRSDASPSKQISPNKDHNEEGRNSNDSDDDVAYSKKKHAKSPRKRKLKADLKPVVHQTTTAPSITGATAASNIPSASEDARRNGSINPTGNRAASTDSDLTAKRADLGHDRSVYTTIPLNDTATVVIERVLHEQPAVPSAVLGENLPAASDSDNCVVAANCDNAKPNAVVMTRRLDEHDAGIAEWDCNTSIESMELRLSPDHDPEQEAEQHSAESESEFCEETSQDNINSDSEDSVEEMEIESTSSNSPGASENSNTGEEISWSRDEDKVILQTLQSEGGSEDTFKLISERLESRTITQVKQRFNTLLNLIRKMTDVTS